MLSCTIRGCARSCDRACWFARPPLDLRSRARRGGYLKYDLDPQEDALKRGQRPAGELWGSEAPERWGTLQLAQGDSFVSEKLPTAAGDYRQYYQNVRDAMLGAAPLAVTAEQALRVMRALELAVESSRQRCVVPGNPEPGYWLCWETLFWRF